MPIRFALRMDQGEDRRVEGSEQISCEAFRKADAELRLEAAPGIDSQLIPMRGQEGGRALAAVCNAVPSRAMPPPVVTRTAHDPSRLAIDDR
jgi:hypothetical protein